MICTCPAVLQPYLGYAAGVLLALLCCNGPVHAGNLSFLNDTAMSKFNDDDVRIMQETVFSLLKDGTAGQSQSWANPNSTAKGTITVMKVFQSTEGFACKTLRIENSAQGLQGRSTYPLCRIPPGDWKIHTGAKPAATPAATP
jgi:surface antigen